MLELIVEPLLAWYDANARVLPWREDPSPYRVWVSEIMLQQTRVEAVRPFFQRFITALPQVEDLARCDEERLLKLWEGLGYYNRVRNMQKAARIIADDYQGRLPADYEKLLQLPGIGSYTAGAVSSIAYGIATPAVDGNVLRVLARIQASEEDIMKQSVRKTVERQVMEIIPEKRPGAFNQALMELGAMVCIPKGAAKCEQCPLNGICRARQLGMVAQLPRKAPKKPRRVELRTVLLLQDGERSAIRKRKPQGLLAGMYEFPNLTGHLDADQVLAIVKEWGLAPVRIQQLEPAKHIFSHVEWQMIGYTVKIEEPDKLKEDSLVFVEAWQTENKYPIPAAFLAYARYMNVRLGQEKFE